MDIDEFKAKAFEKFESTTAETRQNDLVPFLYSLNWNVPHGKPFGELKMAKLNLDFDVRGCFGRSVKAAVLSEMHYPNESVYAGEVCEDLLRTILVNDAGDREWEDETYIAEILQYEHPHFVLVHKEGQFDPIFKQLSDTPAELEHPTVKKHDLWAGLYAAYLISVGMVSFLENRDPHAYLEYLQRADEACSDVIAVEENKISVYAAMGNYGRAEEILHSVYQKRKDAKTLMGLYIFTENERYKKEIIEEYSEQMLNYLNQRLT